jgi:hypothetical protein
MTDPSQMAHFIKTYQTLIVGVLGFAGVVATLFINAWRQRKTERRRIEHETRALRIALIEEMKAQRNALVHSAEGAKEAKNTSGGGSALTPLRRWSNIFDGSLDKLGLLT